MYSKQDWYTLLSEHFLVIYQHQNPCGIGFSITNSQVKKLPINERPRNK